MADVLLRSRVLEALDFEELLHLEFFCLVVRLPVLRMRAGLRRSRPARRSLRGPLGGGLLLQAGVVEAAHFLAEFLDNHMLHLLLLEILPSLQGDLREVDHGVVV